MTDVPDAVRQLAELPGTYGPEPPPGSPVVRVRDGRFTAVLPPGPSSQMVEALDLSAGVDEAVNAVRTLLRSHGREQAVWFVTPGARPRDLVDRLLERGFERAEKPPWEPSFAAMALLSPPEPGPSEIVVKPVETLEEFVAAQRLNDDIAGFPEADRRAWDAQRDTLWQLYTSGASPVRLHLGFLDGELVGIGRSLLADVAVNLSGGAVREDARGRGVYRALVRARWEAAAARGTPALTVQAGRMSRPVLEGLGFATLSEQSCLLDRFGPG